MPVAESRRAAAPRSRAPSRGSQRAAPRRFSDGAQSFAARPAIGVVVLSVVAQKNRVVRLVDDEPNAVVDADRPEVSVLAAVQPVKLHPRICRVHLKVKRRCFDEFLLVSCGTGEAVSEGVGDAEVQDAQRWISIESLAIRSARSFCSDLCNSILSSCKGKPSMWHARAAARQRRRPTGSLAQRAPRNSPQLSVRERQSWRPPKSCAVPRGHLQFGRRKCSSISDQEGMQPPSAQWS